MIVVTIIIVLIALVGLMALHELGHFLLAKKFGVRVEEFGVGYPPRIWGKRIGETIYSINLLPFGAFVKLTGENKRVKDPKSFSQKSLWQRALILLGGVVSFWIIAIIILTFVAGIGGVPTAIPDDLETGFNEAKVQIFGVAPNSPAEEAGIEVGDIITKLREPDSSTGSSFVDTNRVSQVQDFISSRKGGEVVLTLERGKEVLDVSLAPRVSPPKGEGAIGVSLARVANMKTTWYKAPWQGFMITVRQTKAIPVVLGGVLKRKIQGEKVMGVEFRGPIGIGQMMGSALNQGVGNFLMLVSMISIWLALFNLVPIPALDGGRLLFLVIEGVRKKPVSQRIEQRITATFFALLICLMVFVTVKDIIRLF